MARTRRRRSVKTEGTMDEVAEMRSGGETVKRKRKQRRIPVEFEDVAPEHLGHVSVAGGMTTEIVDGEYAKLNVMVSLPSLPDDDSLAATKERASDMIQDWLREEYNNAVEFFDSDDEE